MNRDGRRAAAAGFTLVEMVAVLAIVGLLAAAARPLWVLSAQRRQEAELRQALRSLRGAIDAYHDAALAGRILQPPPATGWPPNLRVLVDGVPLAEQATGLPEAGRLAGGPPQRLYLLRRLPRDPMADPALPPERHWGLRASDSPPQAVAPPVPPAPGSGRDVFDVQSLSPRRALDGSRYRDW